MYLKNLVYVHYLDHTLVKYSSPSEQGLMEREAIGWLVNENDTTVWIVLDRCKSLSQIETDSCLILLKAAIIELKHLDASDLKYPHVDMNACRLCASGRGGEKLGHSGRR
jgi:hypothetical protein